MSPLLSVEGLEIGFHRGDKRQAVVRDMSFTLHAGQTLGVVGESGAGKSLLALAILGLLPENAYMTGAIRLEGQDLLRLPEKAFCQVRGSRIGMIFQEPLTALNPAMTVGDQIAEGMVWHKGMSWKAARAEALLLMQRVRLPDASRKMQAYAHELSGGQRQRIGIAIAIALKPALLIADEPTTALDVTVQAEVLDILDELCRDEAMSLMMISHDLGVIARMCQRILVLYEGCRMEKGATRAVLTAPNHPYTRGLIMAQPRRRKTGERLSVIEANANALPEPDENACPFSPRCRDVMEACTRQMPPWQAFDDMNGVRCLRFDAAAKANMPDRGGA